MKIRLIYIILLVFSAIALAEPNIVVEGIVSEVRILPNNTVDFSIEGHENIRICKSSSTEPLPIDPDKTLVYRHILDSYENLKKIRVTYKERLNQTSMHITKCLMFVTLIK